MIVHSTIACVVSKVQISPVRSNNTRCGDSIGDWSRPPMIKLPTQCYQTITNNLINENSIYNNIVLYELAFFLHTYIHLVVITVKEREAV